MTFSGKTHPWQLESGFFFDIKRWMGPVCFGKRRAGHRAIRGRRDPMDHVNPLVLLSITLGGAIFLGLVLFWFIAVYLKKRVAPNATIKAAVSLPRRPWEEKRVHPRLSVSWNASIATAHGVLNAQLRDISQGGAFVVCPMPLPLSERFEIVIGTPERPPLTLQAEVVWSNANVPVDAIVNRGMGVRFVGNDAGRRQALAEALSSLLEEDRPPAG